MQKETNYLQVKDYFQNLVANSNFLKDFSGYFSREFFNKTDSFEGFAAPGLVLFKYEAGLDSNGQNTIAVRRIGFSIVFNNVSPDDYDAQYKAINDAEILAGKVLARMRYDAMQQGHFLFNAFIKESVQILPFELSASNFGVDVLFSIRNPQNNAVDVADWKDITKVC